MRREKLPISKEKMLNRIVSSGMKVPEGFESLSLPSLIRILRHGFGMTQAQLAKRAGLLQSHIAQIELGHVDLQWSTVQKVFRALNSDVVVLPKFKEKPKAIIAKRARETAKRKVARVAGTSALEKQLPDEQTRRRLLHDEEERLKNNHSSEIWE